MKSRIAQELRRSDLTSDIANAIATAIDVYKFRKFSFSATTFVDAPATDGETNNAWMTTAETLIRCRAKFELYAHVIKKVDAAQTQAQLAQEAYDRLRLSVSNTGTATADTLGFMKLRIANEINRSELSDEIANAVTDAIDCYNAERLYFAETRDVTFNTIALQERYDENTVSTPTGAFARILKIDYAFIYIGGNPQRLVRRDPETLEYDTSGTTSSPGQPGGYGFYGGKLILDPIPSDVFTVRLGCVLQIAAPASDGEASNPWMMRKHAEALIRNKAKALLYVDVKDIADANEAQKFMGLAQQQLEFLHERTEAKAQPDTFTIQAWSPY